MMNELEPVWKVIDGIRENIAEHASRIQVCETKQNYSDDRYNVLCEQLKTTEKGINAKLDFLIAEYHKAQGAKGAVNWLPTIISCVVGLIAIYTFVSK
jgi:hypothetical protein